MNIHDHYNDLLHLLDLTGYPSSKLDGPVPEYDDPDGVWGADQTADCCAYLTGILVAHMEQLAENQPEHKDTQADVDQAIRRLKEIQSRGNGGAA